MKTCKFQVYILFRFRITQAGGQTLYQNQFSFRFARNLKNSMIKNDLSHVK